MTPFKQRLKALGLTQKAFCNKAGYKTPVVSHWCTGYRKTPDNAFRALDLLEAIQRMKTLIEKLEREKKKAFDEGFELAEDCYPQPPWS